MCSNSINKALKTVDFIQEVDADIKTYTFKLSFRPNSLVDFDMIKNRVEKAGFSVSSFVANIHFSNAQVRSNQPVIIQNKTFVFLNTKDQFLNGHQQVKLIDKGFISAKEYKKFSFTVLYPQTYHVTL